MYRGWLYKVSKTWSGSTLIEAQANMESSSAACSFWVTMNRLDTNNYIQNNSNSYVACSLLLKISSLFAHQTRIELSSDKKIHGGSHAQAKSADGNGGQGAVSAENV